MYRDEFEETLAIDEADTLQATGRRVSRKAYKKRKRQQQPVYSEPEPAYDTTADDAEMKKIQAEMAKMEAEAAAEKKRMKAEIAAEKRRMLEKQQKMQAVINRLNTAQSGIEKEMRRESNENIKIYKVMELVERVKSKIQSINHRITELREHTQDIQRGI